MLSKRRQQTAAYFAITVPGPDRKNVLGRVRREIFRIDRQVDSNHPPRLDAMLNLRQLSISQKQQAHLQYRQHHQQHPDYDQELQRHRRHPSVSTTTPESLPDHA